MTKVKNAVRCKKCGDIIESKSRHDFQMCSCKSCYVDGGSTYFRVGGNFEDIEILREEIEIESNNSDK